MYLILLLWAVDCIAMRRLPVIARPLWIAALFLLAEGCIAIANPQGSYDRINLVFTDIKQWLPYGPGVIDRFDAVPTLIRQMGVLGMVCFVTDIARRPVWRTRIWWTVALTGVSIVLCGLGMKICDYHIVSYTDPTDVGLTSFAFYFYHANAGAYVNLVLPLVAGLAAQAFFQPRADAQRALWLPGTVLCVAGAVGTLSKGAMVISGVLVVILAAWFVQRGRDKGVINLSPTGALVAALGTLAVLGAMVFLSWSQASVRWSEMENTRMTSGAMRLVTYQVCTRMFPDSGIWGFGPANFTIAFPHYTGDLGAKIAGVWIYAHEDYLQTIIEWGFIGAAVWAVVLFGGLWIGISSLRTISMSNEDTVLLTMALLSLGGVLVHATFDFPLQIASLQLYVATLLGLCWGSRSFAASATATPARRRRRTSASAAESQSV